MNSALWFLSFVLLVCGAASELIQGPGGRLLHSECHVELPANASLVGDMIVFANGTEIAYPRCAHISPDNSTSTSAAPSLTVGADADADRKRTANGWNSYLYFYPGYALDQFWGDWVVPTPPGQGYRGQLLYYFTALEPAAQNIILQPVLWYGISPAGGGNAWFAACWEVRSDNSYTTSPVARVYPGQTIRTAMVRSNGQFYCEMKVDNQVISAANFADRDYRVAFTTLEVYNVADCWMYPYQQTTNFFNLAVHQTGGNFVPLTWTGTVKEADCGQSVATIGTVNGITYGLPALLSPLVFDANYYKATNGDLPWSDYANLANHWQNNGVHEGRTAVAGFWVSEYKAIYGDIAPLSNVDAISHYASNGYQEGRVGRQLLRPLVFNYIYYTQKYGDLFAAFGFDRNSLNNHWMNSGLAEGRQGVSTFWAPQYLNLYADLRGAFGTNYAAAASHYINNGYAEGRRGV